MRRLRLGMIGAGKTATWHLRAYQRLPQVEIVAIANPISERGKALAGRYGARHLTDGFALIADLDLDCLDVCVPTGLHKDFILAALRKGLHVYTEKPMGASVEEIEEMIEANRKTQKVLFNGFNYRFLPEFRRIRAIIQSGRLGEIRYIRMVRTTKERPDSYLLGPHACGLFNEFHGHFVDLMFSFGFGDPEKVSAFGVTVHDWDIDPDTATMVLSYPNKMIVEITASIATPGLAPEMLVIGKEGTLRLRDGRVSTVKKRDLWPLSRSVLLLVKESIGFPHRVLRNPFQGSCQHFIESILANRRSVCDEQAALRTFRITAAARKSYAEKRPIPI